ncbi:MAG: glutaredoxin domain-containing protein [Polyangiaceae bacterium]
MRSKLLVLVLALVACGGSPDAPWDPPPRSAADIPSEGSVVTLTPDTPPAPDVQAPAPHPVVAAATLDEAMREVPITMYMATWCPVCRKARGWLQEGGFRFTEFDVETNPRAGRVLRSLNPRGTIPMFDIDGRILIGFAPELLEGAIRRAAEERRSAVSATTTGS